MAVPTISISALCCLICIGLSIAWGVTMQEEWDALGQPLPPPEPPAPPSPSPPVINPPPQPRGPPPLLPPAPLTKTLLHSDKICEDGSMATGDLDLDTCAHNAFAAGATCIAHVPNGCWICDSCTPIIDYPDGDLYELSADYSPPTPLAPPQPPAPAFYEVKADNSRACLPSAMPSRSWLAMRARATSAPAARRARPGGGSGGGVLRAGVAGREGLLRRLAVAEQVLHLRQLRGEGVPGQHALRVEPGVQPAVAASAHSQRAAGGAGGVAASGTVRLGQHRRRAEALRLRWTDGRFRGREGQAPRLRGERNSYVCQSVALSVVPGHPLCINNPDCIDVSEFKALAQDLFVTNLMDLLLELANAIAIFAAYYCVELAAPHYSLL